MMTRVVSLWTSFQGAAEKVERGPFFDLRSRWLYAIIFAIFAIDVIWFLASDFTLSFNAAVGGFGSLLWVALAGLISRRYGFEKIGLALEACALPAIVGALMVILSVFLTPLSAPFADPLLVAADKALGFDWRDIFQLYDRYPLLTTLTEPAYNSLAPQVILIALALCSLGHCDRCWTFMTAWAIGILLSVAIYPFFPAEGAFVTFGYATDSLTGFDVINPWLIGPLIEDLRAGRITDLADATKGLVSFPSFHFAAAVLFAWAGLAMRWVRIPLIVLNVVMGFSTIIMGAHYLIDLIGGGVVAVAAIWLAKRLVEKSEN
jgi:membrane-associated phospholipid phosphatase